MSEFVHVAKTSDLKPGEVKTVEAGGNKIALYNVAGKFFATQNNCLHMQGPLGEGILDENLITCPWHGWQYNVETGENPMMPTAKLRVFEVKVEGDSVMVNV